MKILNWWRKRWWIHRAAIELRKYSDGSWSYRARREYAEDLYACFVLDEPNDPWSPVDAVAEDVSYW